MSENNALVKVENALKAEDMQGKFIQMLPKEVPVDKFTEIAMMAIRQTPELLEADRQTLYDSCLALARRGLLPDKKEAALVVYSTNVAPKGAPKRYVKKVQELPMVLGIIKELAKVGVTAYAVSVYEGDTFDFWNDDDGQHVKHKPKVFGDRGKRLGAFACGKLPDGRTYVEAMNMEELERVAMRSRQSYEDKSGVRHRGGTWKSDPERMEQKSCLHRLRKRIPVDLPPDDDPDFDPNLTLPAPIANGDAQAALSAPQGSEATDDPVPAAEAQEPPRRTGKRRPAALRAVIEHQQQEDESQEHPDYESEVSADFESGDIV